MLKPRFEPILQKNKLLLPDQPYHDDFLLAMQKVFHCSRLIGVLGTRKYISYFWSFTLLCELLCIEAMAIWKLIKALAGMAIDTVAQRSVAVRFAGTLFYSISILSLLLSSRLSLSWHNLASAWAKTESSMLINIPVDRTVKVRMYVATGFMLMFSLTEHFISVMSHVGFDCPPKLILKRYVLLSHGFMILRHEYSEWFALPLAIISIIANLLWNFQDLIIVLISIGLTSRYNRLNKYLAKVCVQDKNTTASVRTYTWRKLREAYVKQAVLVRRMDKALGAIIILSCFGNFYFISLQLFLGITQGPSSSPVKKVYYIVSLAWLCIRVSSVILSASAINVHSQMALKHIYTYETRGYNIEVKRLQDQLDKDYVALSGMGFFYLNKTILLQMTGAIITYELMLIQYDNKGADTIDSVYLNTTQF